MIKRSSFPFISLFCFLFLWIACSPDDEEDEDDINSPYVDSEFSTDEMAVLNVHLDLNQTLYNYSQPALPEHFRSDEANESDNTPEYNQITDFGATLGRVLFYDKQLSINNRVSCASCHKQNEGFSDRRRFSRGFNEEQTARNSMTLINSRYYENGKFFWDERAATLEEQVLIPIEDHKEMGLSLDSLVNRLTPIPHYKILFTKAFGDSTITTNRIAMALSQFTRSIISYRTKFDEGFALVGFPEDEEEMPDFPNFTAQENMGLDIFYRGRNGATCLYCHGSPQHVNDEAKNNGLDLNYTDKGKGAFTGKAEDMALFKVPSLRNIALTAPYMHDGRFNTLMEVVNHYSSQVKDHPNLNFRLKDSDDPSPNSNVLRLNLSNQEKEALVAFLHTLTDDELTNDPKFSNPFKP